MQLLPHQLMCKPVSGRGAGDRCRRLEFIRINTGRVLPAADASIVHKPGEQMGGRGPGERCSKLVLHGRHHSLQGAVSSNFL